MIVGSRLKAARKKQNLTQEKLGELLGVSKSAVSLYESEQRNPSLESVVELMYILGVSADYLLGSDVIVEVLNEENVKYQTFTKEEVAFRLNRDIFYINEISDLELNNDYDFSFIKGAIPYSRKSK